MKKLIIIILVILIFSCNPYIDRKWDTLPNLISVWDNIKTLSDIETWIYKNIKYKKDGKDFWQYPDETLLKGHGDCEDRALLFCAMANKLLNKKPMFALYQYDQCHAEAVYNKIEYFSLSGNCYLLAVYNYNEIAFEIEMHRF